MSSSKDKGSTAMDWLRFAAGRTVVRAVTNQTTPPLSRCSSGRVGVLLSWVVLA